MCRVQLDIEQLQVINTNTFLYFYFFYNIFSKVIKSISSNNNFFSNVIKSISSNNNFFSNVVIKFLVCYNILLKL